MAGWSKLDKCCSCLRLDLATRLIGIFGLLSTLGLFVFYLVKLEDVRDFILDDLYGIPPCTIPPIDTLTDSTFEYSLLANLLLIIGCVSCTRWLLVPWLCVYLLNMILLVCVSVGMFLVPIPILQGELQGTTAFQALRLLGLVPLLVGLVIFYLWLVVRSRFIELGKAEKSEEDQCCPMKLKTGVQILAGILAILSAVMLVIFFAKLDDLISRQYFNIFQVEISNKKLNLMGGSIVISILVNILLILGCSGKKWRRALAFPWLIFYGNDNDLLLLLILTLLKYDAGRLGCRDSHLDPSLLHFPLLERRKDDWSGLSGGRLHIPDNLVSR